MINFVWHLSLEGYLGVIIAIFIIKASIDMLKETIDIMIGERGNGELTKKIKKKVCSYKEVEGAYDLTLHNYGPLKTIATVHVQLRDDMTAREIHVLTRTITMDIYEEFGIILTLGIYASNNTGKYGDIKKTVLKEIKKYKYIKQIHGFYVNDENKNIYFDLIFDFDCKNIDEIKDNIIKDLKKEYPKYEFNVILDADFSD